MLWYVGCNPCLSATINGCIPKGCSFFCVCAPQACLQGHVYKLFKPFLQIRERDDLIVVFVIHCSINCYDNQTKNHCSERDPPRLRSEHKFYGISLLISLYTVICIYRKLSRDVPVFAQIGAAGSQTNQADSNKPDAIRQNLQRQNHG